MKNEERGYELTVLFPLQLKEKDKTQEALKKEIEKAGIIEKEEDWGEKKLAYPIKKNEKGHFYFYEFKASLEKIKTLEEWLKLNENILRYLIVLKV